jgi:xanthine/uracil permease
MISGIIAVPIVVGAAFDLSTAEISSFMQRMFFITGVATLLQLFWGHRLPLIEGSAGMWWALFTLMAAMAPAGDKGIVLQQLEMGLIAAGVMLIVVSLLPIMHRIRELFTPLVTGVYLCLLVLQLCGAFFKGMLGVSMTGHVDFRVAGVSLVAIVLVLLVSNKGKGLFRSMGPLVGITMGWGLFALLGLTEPRVPSDEAAGWFSLPELFAWGAPVWDFGVVLTALVTGAILISNVVASILVLSKTVDQEADTSTLRRGLLGNGVNSILSGGLSVVGLVPLSVSAGFIMTTGIRARLPFIIGAILVAISGLLPFVGQFFAMLPSEVAYAATFIPFAQMFGFGVRDLMGIEPSNRNLLIIGMTFMVGVGVMFLPPDALITLPPWARNLFANGLLVGLIVCLLLEHVVFRKRDNKAI